MTILHWLGVLILFVCVCVCAGILSAVIISAFERARKGYEGDGW